MELLTAGEAAAHLGVPRSTFNDWVNAQYILPASVSPGGWRRFTKTDLDRFAKTLQGDGS